MSSISEASELLVEIAGPHPSVKRLLMSAHNKLAKHNWSANRVRDVYHADSRIRISSDEMDTLRQIARKNKEDAQAAAAGNAYAELLSRVAEIETAFRVSRENVGGNEIDEFRRVLGGMAGPVDSK